MADEQVDHIRGGRSHQEVLRFVDGHQRLPVTALGTLVNPLEHDAYEQRQVPHISDHQYLDDDCQDGERLPFRQIPSQKLFV